LSEEQQAPEAASEELVTDLSSALRAVADEMSAPENENGKAINAAGTPTMFVMIVRYGDPDTGPLFTAAHGPGYTPEAHLQAIGEAGSQVMEQMRKAQPIIMPPPSGLILPH
jgi:hypothetical protein